MFSRRLLDDIHVVEGGVTDAPALLFLHGWPQSSAAFERVMEHLADELHVIAIDLPGIGASTRPPAHGDKRHLADIVAGLISKLSVRDVTLVGHDVGGMIAYACVRAHRELLARTAILNTVIPGIDPWQQVIANPRIWHFAFHGVPALPELLVAGHEAAYFDYFFDAIAATPSAIDRAARDRYVAAYQRAGALHTGFEWYRALERDAHDNEATRDPVDTPALYVRGDRESGDLASYAHGLREAGLGALQTAEIADCGHFSADEQPRALADVLRRFVTDRAQQPLHRRRP
jgi:pimeloyl-ACP methyl ester carboxylesterase